jgi:prephenate dehydratase
VTIAYLGEPGAFSHEACLKFVPDHEPLARPSFAGVIAAVVKGEADLGILPVENSGAGPVEEARALLAACGLPIVATHSLQVRMHLLGLPGATLDDVTTVISHPMALAQSARSLETLGLATETATNTAIAARMLQARQDKAIAVLASEAAAAIYGLEILRRDVHDDPDNRTLFTVIGPVAKFPPSLGGG